MLIDHLHGRRVTGVISRGKADWGIQLEGDVIIWNTDDRRTAIPDESELLSLSLISSGESGDNIDLDFGTVAEDGTITNAVGLSFTGSQHRIAGPGTSGIEEEVEIPEMPEERIADGPSQEWVDQYGNPDEADEAAHDEWVEKTALEATEKPQEATDADA